MFRSTVIRAAAFSLAVLVCFPHPAHARFGKGGSSGGHSSSSHGSSSHASGSYHSAAPVATARPYVGPSYGTAYPRYYSPAYGWRSRYAWWYGYYPYYPIFGYGPPYGYYPYDYYVGAPPSVAVGPSRIITTLGIDGQVQSSGGGSSIALNLGFEGQRFGVAGEFQSFFLKASDGISTDNISLLNVYLTYALIASPHGRLRLEAGVTTAFAPDLVVAGPGIGLSAVASIWGPLGIEGSTHVTPIPYTQFDWQAGIGLGFGPVGIRGGWRRVYLNDRGLVDGISHEDAFSGPYLGVTVTL
jgi:hypothetical protein